MRISTCRTVITANNEIGASPPTLAREQEAHVSDLARSGCVRRKYAEIGRAGRFQVEDDPQRKAGKEEHGRSIYTDVILWHNITQTALVILAMFGLTTKTVEQSRGRMRPSR